MKKRRNEPISEAECNIKIEQICHEFGLFWQAEIYSNEYVPETGFEALYRSAYQLFQQQKDHKLIDELEKKCLIKLKSYEEKLVKPVIDNYGNFRIILLAFRRKHYLIYQLPLDIWKVIFNFCHNEMEVIEKVPKLVKQCKNICLSMGDILCFIDRSNNVKSFELILCKNVQHLSQSTSLRKKIWTEFLKQYNLK